ncbi:MAG: GIY-YIG nuclease family protein [Ignavibacteriae bacterium]|nr:GIY-YIG nuclease family protein [Ignavibacteriota bacterium]
MKNQIYFVYILASKKNGTLYIGITNNLIRRIVEHKEKIIKGFTAKYDIDKLVYYETYNYVNDAIKREKDLKEWHRKWKIRLIEKENKEWRDLFYDLVSEEEIKEMKELILIREEEHKSVDSGQKRAGMTE